MADLVSTYGSAWASDPNLFWGVAATNQATSDPTGRDPVFSLWATDPEITPGTLNTPWRTGCQAQQGTPASNIAYIVHWNQWCDFDNKQLEDDRSFPTSQGDRDWTTRAEAYWYQKFRVFQSYD